MKQILVTLLACGVLAGGCASDKGADSNAPAKQQQEKKPEVGMTKEEVITMFGKTDNMQVSSEGETWIYHLNKGDAYIPFNFGYRPKILMVQFDKDGKVIRWNYTK